MLLGWIMVVLTIILTVAGQIIVKWQVSKAGVPASELGEIIPWLIKMALNPWLILVLIMVVMAGSAWFVAMSRLPLSHTYPILGISFPLVLLGSIALLGESVSPLHLIGTALVFAGVVVLGLASR